ncbi:MAG: YqgE/AlgH family protein [Hyphomicrobiaceae bacterium]|nr:YqgE/AlgH family protein [Hyphomicrobiaceae bacterium]MCC0023035.1 YqgE/AlgH family protein [Hyphomicrobiaceae bacterium]
MQSLKGQFLIAMPQMNDSRFERSVIFMVDHNEQGAMGLIVNKPLDDLNFGDVLDDLDLAPDEESEDHPVFARELPVWNGGPVEPGRGFVLHSADYYQQGASVRIRSDIVLSANHDILSAIATEHGQPDKSLFALGYAGWGPGQLDVEMAENAWLNVKGDASLVFSVPADQRYMQALASIGLNPANLSGEAGLA